MRIQKCCVLLLTACATSAAQAADVTPYGAFNLGLEYRDIQHNTLQNGDKVADHTAIQDYFSFVGLKGEHSLNPEITGFFDYRLSVDTSSGRLEEDTQTVWAGNGVEENIAYLGVKGVYGQLSVGTQWNAYWNTISATTDKFSSGWTGFDTLAGFQLPNLIAYQAPEMGNLSLALNLQVNGAEKDSTSNTPGQKNERKIVAGRYVMGQHSLGIAFDDLGEGDSQLFGIAWVSNINALRLAGKAEQLQNGAPDKNGKTGDGLLISLQAILSHGANRYKIHYATGDYPVYLPVGEKDASNKGSEIKLGIDRSISPQFYIFLEYQQSNDYCAYDLTEGNGNGGYDNIDGNEIYGCSLFATGAHFSF